MSLRALGCFFEQSNPDIPRKTKRLGYPCPKTTADFAPCLPLNSSHLLLSSFLSLQIHPVIHTHQFLNDKSKIAEIFQDEKRSKARSMSSGRSSPMEPSGAHPCPHGDAPAASAKKLWRAMQTVYLVVVKKHQPKLAALGVHLHHLLSSSRRDRRDRSLASAREQHPALEYLSSLSCRSMDPGAAVHPYPRRGRRHGHGHRRASSSSRPAGPSLSCRSMDPAAAVCQYQYRPREVEFSCKTTPMHNRRRREQRLRRLQERAAAQEREYHSSGPEYYYGSAAAVTTLFALMDVEEEEAEATDLVDHDDDGDLDLEAKVAWPAPRQVRITDSPYLLWDDDKEEGWGAVDRLADEFITRFREQLRA